MPLSILTYANGPGFEDHLEVHKDEIRRKDLRDWEGYTDFETRQPTSAPNEKETHSGSDVAIFALGKFVIHNS
jgi:hypothetical protein